jgi:hypothetical protein
VRHGTCFRRRLSARHAGAAPHSAVAELGVVRRCSRYHMNHTFTDLLSVTTLTAILVFLASKWIEARVTASIKAEYDRKLAEYQADLRKREQEDNRKFQEIDARLNKEFSTAIFHAGEIIDVEGTIDDQALSIYGINLEGADERVTAERIRYLVALVNAQNVRFGKMKEGKDIDQSELRRMFDDEDYMPRVFKQPTSREVWRFARRCFREDLRRNIDDYLTVEYEDEFTSRPMEKL